MALFRSREAAPATAGPRRRLKLSREPEVIYAIGDVHGQLDQLRELETFIVTDAARAGAACLIVMLGDYVDRGPDSSGVLSHLIAPPPDGCYRLALIGNHDLAFLEVLDGREPPRHLLGFGGAETFRSYGCDLEEYEAGLRFNQRRLTRELAGLVPEVHRHYLRALPVSFETPNYFFVHAGVRPGVPLPEQSESDLIEIREPFLSDGSALPKIVVHGHTATRRPIWDGRRIGVDTGSCFGGELTAARITPSGVDFLSVA